MAAPEVRNFVSGNRIYDWNDTCGSITYSSYIRMFSRDAVIGPRHRLNEITIFFPPKITRADILWDGNRPSVGSANRLNTKRRLVVFLQSNTRAFAARRYLPEKDLAVLKILTRLHASESEDLHILSHHSPYRRTGYRVLSIGRAKKMRLPLFPVRDKHRRVRRHGHMDLTALQRRIQAVVVWEFLDRRIAGQYSIGEGHKIVRCPR